MITAYQKFVHAALAALFVVLLGGCAIAPGMYYDDFNAQVEPPVGEQNVSPIIRTITQGLVQAERLAAQSQKHDELEALIAEPIPYKIGAGDVLGITVWEHPELLSPRFAGDSTAVATTALNVSGYTVGEDGKIQFPYAGDMMLAGMTELEARDALGQKLSTYIRDPQITLKVITYRSKRIYVDGEVKNPGIVQVDDLPLTIAEAINRAGGVTAQGDRSRISLVRAGKQTWIDLPGLIESGYDPSRLLLKSGDMIKVSSRDESKVFVVGEVTKPVALPMHNGRLSLNEALGEAGGVSSATGDANQIYVIRNAADARPLVYHLDAHSPVMFALAQNFDLKPKDVIYVDAAPMVRFNRIISLILPTAQTITIVNRGFQ
jgi:polysaccharide export outer membrane protein